MQAVISTRSKSKYYNGDPDDEHVPEDLGATEHDEIGIVHAICVKVHSSAQRKEAFKAIQYCHRLPPLQLLLDMKVRWSSTFIMLTRAESRRQVSVHIFLFVVLLLVARLHRQSTNSFWNLESKKPMPKSGAR